MYDPMETRRLLGRLEASKARSYTDAQVEIISEVLLDVTPEQLGEGVETLLRTHKYQTLPQPADFVEALGCGRGAGGKTWAQNAAGGKPPDLARYGEALARAIQHHDDDRREYYQSLLDHMTASDRELAEKALTDTLDEVPDNLNPGVRLSERTDAGWTGEW